MGLLFSHCSRVQLFVTPRTVVHQAILSMGFSRQQYWEWVAMPSSRGSSLLQGSNLHLLQWQADSFPLSHQGSPSQRVTHAT